MYAAFGFVLMGLSLSQASTSPDISGQWAGPDWGVVILKKTEAGEYVGTFNNIPGKRSGELRLSWSATENRYKGKWREDKKRFGKISLRRIEKSLHGAWTSNRTSRLDSGTPELADFHWRAHDPLAGNVALSSRGAKVEGPESHAHHLLDGITTGYHGTRGWARSLTPDVWQITLPREYPLRQIRLLLYDRDKRAFRYTIETSIDGRRFELVADRSQDWSRSWQIHSFEERPVRYIQIRCLDSTFNNRPREDGFFAVELEAYCRPPQARLPVPVGRTLGGRTFGGRTLGGPIPSTGEALQGRSIQGGAAGGDGRASQTPARMLEFSGRRQSYVDIPQLRYNGEHPITLEAIVMSLYSGSIIADFNGGGLGMDVAHGKFAFHVNDGREADNGYAWIRSPTSIAEGKRVHIAGVLDGSEMRFFVAGQLVGKKTVGAFVPSEFSFMVGADPGGEGEPTQFLNGVIDELRISNSARYSREFSPPARLAADAQTMLLYRFDEGQGNLAHDASGNQLHGRIYHAKWVEGQPNNAISASQAMDRLRSLGVKIVEENGVATEFAVGNSPGLSSADLGLVQALPTLKSLTLINCANIHDEGFRHLRHLPRLQQLNLSPSNMSDAGLAHLRGMDDLWMLGLNGTKVTDAGMRHLIETPKITVLYLNNTAVTDKGLAFLEPMKDMFWMDLESTGLTDLGLASLGHMSKLRLLSIGRTKVTDEGLPRLARFSSLELLALNDTPVTDAGMVHLAKLKSLKHLILNDTQLTDDGLLTLTSLNRLEKVQVLRTQVSLQGLAAFRQALPNCKVVCDTNLLPLATGQQDAR